MLSETSQAQKDQHQHCVIPLIGGTERSQVQRQKAERQLPVGAKVGVEQGLDEGGQSFSFAR